MATNIKIVDVFKGKESDHPYIIAEAGVNHECDINIARQMIDEAREGGADAIKFQTYRADTIASKDSPAYWDITKEPTQSQYELFQKYDKFWKAEFVMLQEYCNKVVIEFMSTPFDVESADFLNDLMEVFKISSSDITNKPFIEHICQFNKPIMLSTGGSHLREIKEAVSWIERFGNPLALLHCILNYPTLDENANLGMIEGLKDEFPQYIIGYSDHTEPKRMKCLEYAAVLGAKIIEKHFTHDKALPGNDHYHAMDKEDLKRYKQNLSNPCPIKEARMSTFYGLKKVIAIESEQPARENARRSLVIKCDLPENTIIKKQHLTFKRPALGISPKYIDEIIGKSLKFDLKEDTILQYEHFS